jgi:hypothetical protein
MEIREATIDVLELTKHEAHLLDSCVAVVRKMISDGGCERILQENKELTVANMDNLKSMRITLKGFIDR